MYSKISQKQVFQITQALLTQFPGEEKIEVKEFKNLVDNIRGGKFVSTDKYLEFARRCGFENRILVTKSHAGRLNHEKAAKLASIKYGMLEQRHKEILERLDLMNLLLQELVNLAKRAEEHSPEKFTLTNR